MLSKVQKGMKLLTRAETREVDRHRRGHNVPDCDCLANSFSQWCGGALTMPRWTNRVHHHCRGGRSVVAQPAFELLGPQSQQTWAFVTYCLVIVAVYWLTDTRSRSFDYVQKCGLPRVGLVQVYSSEVGIC
jgi:hypothetical protein